MFIIIALLVIGGMVASGDAQCRCMNTCSGRHCGGMTGMSGCISHYIYQCNGVFNSTAHEFGACSISCVQNVGGCAANCTTASVK